MLYGSSSGFAFKYTGGADFSKFLLQVNATGGVKDVSGSNIAQAGTASIHFAAKAITAPVPEPETYTMLLAGMGLMGAIARRRKQK